MRKVNRKRQYIEGAKTVSENNYRQVFERMEDGYFSAEVIRDAAGVIIDWHFLEVNSAVQKHTNLHSSDIIGHLGSAIFPAEKEWLLHAIRHVTDTQRSEHIQQYFDKVDRWFETILFPFGPDRFAVLYHDITDRRRRESNAFVLDCITAELAGLSEPDEIMQNVGALIGDYLKVSSCSFVDVDDDRGEICIQYNWQLEQMPPLKKTYPLKDYLAQSYIHASRCGQTVVISDTSKDERVNAAGYARLKIGALVTVPFIWQGRWIANTCITNIEPRSWKEEEIALLQEMSNRLFARMERARAEEALRRSEEKYRALFESVDEGFCIIQMIFDDRDQPVDWLYLDANPKFERHAGFNPVGKKISDIIPNVEPSWLRFYGEVARTRIPGRKEDLVASLNCWFSVAAAPVRDSRDVIAVVFDDITARKLAEKALRVSEQMKSFLLGLSDALRSLVNPSDMPAD